MLVRVWPLLSMLSMLWIAACTKAPEPRVVPEADAERQAELAKDERLGPPAKGTKRLEIAPATPPEITVLEVGQDPHVLRLQPVVGAREALQLTMRMRVGNGGGTPMMVSPPVVTKILSEVDVVDGTWIEGTVRFDSMTVEADPDSPAEAIERVRKLLEGFESFQARLQIDERGALGGGVVDVPQGLPEALQQTVNQIQESFGQLQMPLPEEAVGVGARWRAVSRIEQGGLNLKQTTEYHLVAVRGSRLELAVAIEQTVVEPTFTPLGNPDVRGTVDEYRGQGHGTLELDLHRLNPVRSFSRLDIDSTMTLELDGQTTEQTMQMSIALELETVEGAVMP